MQQELYERLYLPVLLSNIILRLHELGYESINTHLPPGNQLDRVYLASSCLRITLQEGKRRYGYMYFLSKMTLQEADYQPRLDQILIGYFDPNATAKTKFVKTTSIPLSTSAGYIASKNVVEELPLVLKGLEQ